MVSSTMYRLTIIAVLTAAVAPLGWLWMSLTSYTYAKLHLFIIAPLVFLYFVPPRPLSNVHPNVRRCAYWAMLLLSMIALVYCIAGWDRILYQTGVFKCPSTFLFLLEIPIEEWIWCIDHPMLACLWVMTIWQSRPVPKQAKTYATFRIVYILFCFSMAYYGYTLTGQGKNYFYLGMTLMYTFPVLAFQTIFGGHLFAQCPREWFIGLIVPSVYVLMIDTFAVERDIWIVNEEYATGIYIFGMRIEHLLIYSLTTSLASQAMVGFIRLAEICQPLYKKTGSAWKALAIAVVRGG